MSNSTNHIKQSQLINALYPDRRLIRGRPYMIIKRMMDLVIILISMPFWLPLLCICALLIKISAFRAPVFFLQERTGKGGQRFHMYKFRTMVQNAESLKKKLTDLNELQWPDFKITKDPRITFMGRLFRKTSLDELPQIWNVIRGDMSLVGPRPTSFPAETYDLWHTERLDIPPGLTGLWQVLGRSSTEFDTRSRLDIAYLERRCLWLDLKILIATVGSVFRQEGAK